MNNLLDFDGEYFRAKIGDTRVEGTIAVEDGSIFLLQNERMGSSPRDKRGYKGSWNVDDGSKESLRRANVYDLIILRHNINKDFKELVKTKIDKLLEEMTISDEIKDVFINAFELGADFGYKLEK